MPSEEEVDGLVGVEAEELACDLDGEDLGVRELRGGTTLAETPSFEPVVYQAEDANDEGAEIHEGETCGGCSVLSSLDGLVKDHPFRRCSRTYSYAIHGFGETANPPRGGDAKPRVSGRETAWLPNPKEDGMQLTLEAQQKAERSSILLLEDDPKDAQLFVEALRVHGFDHTEVVARDGAGALEYLFATGENAGRDAARMPSLVIIDHHMPLADGLEALGRIRADERTRWLPVVMFSGSGSAHDATLAYRLGANACVENMSASVPYSEAVRSVAYFWLCVNEDPPVGDQTPSKDESDTFRPLNTLS